MTLPPKLEKLIDNWPAKVIAFCAALFLYAYYQLTTLDSRVITVPLEIRGVTSTVSVGSVDKYVRVTLRGDAADINRMSREDFTAWIDLSEEYDAGEVRSRVHLDMSEQAVALNILNVELSPAEINLTLESRKACYVPVSPVLVGEVPYGYEVASVTAEPSMVRIVGASGLVDSVSTLDTDGVFLSNRTETFTESVSPYSVKNGLDWDSTDSVAVTVEIKQSVGEKTFSNVPMAILNTSDRFEYELRTRRGSVTISGPQLSLDRYSSSPVGLFIDGSSIHSEGEFRVPVVAGVSSVFSTVSLEPNDVVVVARLIDVEEPEESEVPENDGSETDRSDGPVGGN